MDFVSIILDIHSIITNNVQKQKENIYNCEIGNNHEGDFKLAKKMISLAAKAGADAVKFQTFIPEYYVSSSNHDQNQKTKIISTVPK